MGHHVSLPTAEEVTIPPGHLWTKLPMVLGATGVLSLVAGYLIAEDHHGWTFAWLTGFLYAVSILLGALFFVLIQHASNAGWSVVVRRVAECIAVVLPITALFFIPLYLDRMELWGHWMDPHHAAGDKILEAKAVFLNEPFWTVRAGIYFAIWSGLGIFFWKTSVGQDSLVDRDAARAVTKKQNAFSYPAIILFALSTTFAAVDWAMTLDPHWFSTMWGVWFFAGCCMSGFAFVGLNLLLMKRTGLLPQVNQEHLHDVGKFAYAFTIFWAYISFSQFFLIWYANIPEETSFFHRRMGEGNPWESVGILLMAAHFVIPFLLIMPRTVKRSPTALLIACIYLMCMHFVDLSYAVLPFNDGSEGTITASAVCCALGMFALLWAAVTFMHARAALIPVKDPRLEESMAFVNF
jgi:heme/copper-type cytochrome/quinol oxidase subunit 4